MNGFRISWMLYVIYDNLKDHPGEFVVRKWTIKGSLSEAKMIPEEKIIGKAKTLEGARRFVPDGWVNLGNFSALGEDPVIRESWMELRHGDEPDPNQ